MGTRTPTPEAREPKSRMSTNSITGAYFIFGEADTEQSRYTLFRGNNTETLYVRQFRNGNGTNAV